MILPLGFPQPDVGSTGWWLLRPVWIGLSASVLALLLVTVARFEQHPPSSMPSHHSHPPAAADRITAIVGTILIVFGVLGVAVSGSDPFSADDARIVVFGGNALAGTGYVMLGRTLVRAAVGGTRTPTVLYSVICLATLSILAFALPPSPLALNAPDGALFGVLATACAAAMALGSHPGRSRGVT